LVMGFSPSNQRSGQAAPDRLPGGEPGERRGASCKIAGVVRAQRSEPRPPIFCLLGEERGNTHSSPLAPVLARLNRLKVYSAAALLAVAHGLPAQGVVVPIAAKNPRSV
jgi:hypothetical protein